MKLHIQFKNGESAVVNDFTHVVYGTDNKKTIKAEDMSTFTIFNTTYSFVGDKTSVAALGIDILYIQSLT